MTFSINILANNFTLTKYLLNKLKVIGKKLQNKHLCYVFFRKKLFDNQEPDYEPLPELANVRPGGFDWRRRDEEEDNR